MMGIDITKKGWWSAVARASARLENQAESHDVFLLFIGGFGSDERLGRFVGRREILLEGGFQFRARCDARRAQICFSVSAEKKRSTRLSQNELVGVKCTSLNLI